MMRLRVLAYVTREGGDGHELLVFDHRDYPEAGTQAPAGGVDDGESLDAAVFREVLEETGLRCELIGAYLGACREYAPDVGRMQETHFFHLLAPDETEETWPWVEHSSSGVDLVFVNRWEPLPLQLTLAGGQGRFLETLCARLRLVERFPG
jgi:8-oxo-dGTP pyrophosphatase MutT (NUDIX family)